MKSTNKIRLLIVSLSLFTTGVVVANVPRVITETEGSDLTQKALFYYNSPSKEGLETAYEYAKEAVEKNSNDIVAQRLLGNMYYNGKGVGKDYEEALYHFSLASDNDAVSAYMAGKMYLNGEGSAVDIETGSSLVKQAADMGEHLAQYELAQLSLDQAKIEQNSQMKLNLEKSSLYYAKKCAQQNNKNCMKILASIFQNGLAGIPVSNETAKELYEMSLKGNTN